MYKGKGKNMENVVIDRNKHYWVKMNPLEVFFGIIALRDGNYDKAQWVECEVDESRYKLDDHYKVTLKALDERYGSESFYQTDFRSMLRDGFIVEADGKKRPRFVVERERLCGDVFIEHSGYILA